MRENYVGHWLSSTFGFRGRQNIMAWAVSGAIAYYLWYMPYAKQQENKKAIYEQKRISYEQKSMEEVARMRALADKMAAEQAARLNK
ncbi:hypothetical protein HYH03_003255 [Edaphochlamys debaryana]|uniref:Uncharacterized protein n=1 Tax=Edaphochlamys debaryana TaxID=47281 RepID=A0A835YCJ3_9CHLO|nr:hypothetical protein HYH03_003255 [Edaphochlamys debaryana]|eukprot:KAG2499072.1 hypothetical protein HYH03_003255 [Edaphochlamys debaryana]